MLQFVCITFYICSDVFGDELGRQHNLTISLHMFMMFLLLTKNWTVSTLSVVETDSEWKGGSLNPQHRQDEIISLQYYKHKSPPFNLSSHLFVVFDLVVQDDAIWMFGFLPRQRHTIPGCPVFPYDCDGGWSCKGDGERREERKANWVYLCSNPWQQVLFPFKRLMSIGLDLYQHSAAGL